MPVESLRKEHYAFAACCIVLWVVAYLRGMQLFIPLCLLHKSKTEFQSACTLQRRLMSLVLFYFRTRRHVNLLS